MKFSIEHLILQNSYFILQFICYINFIDIIIDKNIAFFKNKQKIYHFSDLSKPPFEAYSLPVLTHLTKEKDDVEVEPMQA